MMFGDAVRGVQAQRVLVRAMDRILILHADHEQNASTSTVRLGGSTGANPFACIAAGIASCGVRRTAAPTRRCLKMLEEIGDVRRSREFIKQGEGQELTACPVGLRPPRLQELRPARQDDAEDLPRGAGELGLQDDRLFKLAMALEKIALEDEYFVKRKLYPNVDFYSGIV